MEFVISEGRGWFDINKMEARRVPYYYELARMQRAIWINDISLAVFGGEDRQDRIKGLVPEQMVEKRDDLKVMAADFGFQGLQVGGTQEMFKRLDYLEFCKRAGIKP